MPEPDKQKKKRGRPMKPIEQLPAPFEELLKAVVQPVDKARRGE